MLKTASKIPKIKNLKTKEDKSTMYNHLVLEPIV